MEKTAETEKGFQANYLARFAIAIDVLFTGAVQKDEKVSDIQEFLVRAMFGIFTCTDETRQKMAVKLGPAYRQE